MSLAARYKLYFALNGHLRKLWLPAAALVNPKVLAKALSE
jgi:hypothetical protein